MQNKVDAYNASGIDCILPQKMLRPVSSLFRKQNLLMRACNVLILHDIYTLSVLDKMLVIALTIIGRYDNMLG